MKPSLLLGAALRVTAAVMLCAACFQSGRWYQELSASASGPATAKAEPDVTMAELPATLSSGDPVGQSGDIITPLNVRDPSSLVMGPAGSRQECLPPAAVAPESTAMEAKPRKLKKGRLLELLKKEDKTSDVPKSF